MQPNEVQPPELLSIPQRMRWQDLLEELDHLAECPLFYAVLGVSDAELGNSIQSTLVQQIPNAQILEDIPISSQFLGYFQSLTPEALYHIISLFNSPIDPKIAGETPGIYTGM